MKIEKLPNICIIHILSFLSLLESMNLMKTCKRFQILKNNKLLFKNMYQNTFYTENLLESDDWEKQIKERFECVFF